MSKVNDIYRYIDSFAPFSTQLEWDNSGLLIDSSISDLQKALVTLDVTDSVVAQAIAGGYTLIISHHPIIFKPLTNLCANDVYSRCIENHISVISAHTNYDLAKNGVNVVLARSLSLQNIRSALDGMLLLGEPKAQCTCAQLAAFVQQKLQAQIRYNTIDEPIRMVAVCAGAGSDFFAQAKAFGADALVTGDAKYHEFIDAAHIGISLIAAGHYETEIAAVQHLADLLSAHFSDVEFTVSNAQSPIITI